LTCSVYIATSLDGFIADADGGIGWLMEIPNPEGSDYGFQEFMAGVDAVVMGRKTFEQVVEFEAWPYEKPVFVLSNSTKSVPDQLAGKAEVVGGEPSAIVDQLAGRGLESLYVDGGRTVQSFLAEDLIDELTITRVSVLLGEGIPLFGTLPGRLDFALVSTERLSDYLVKQYYRRVRR